ncbi:MAG: hypothetical protein Q9169_003596 [Polycauliona sp. 2 TL-2023]
MHSSHSFVVLFVSFLLPLARSLPQGRASAQLLIYSGPSEATTAAAGQSCGGCAIIADVAGIVWYEEVFVNTAATAFVGVAVGNNGSRATRTSIVQNDLDFTFNPQASEQPGAVVVTNAVFDTSTEIGGATLQSPTAVNVYTAFTITSQELVNGACATSADISTLSVAYTQNLATASGRVYLDQALQQDFLNYIGFSTCRNAANNFANTVLAPVSGLTVSTTSTFSNVALAAMSTTFAPSPTSSAPRRTTTLTDVLTTLTATLDGSSTITEAPVQSAEVAEIVFNGTTITPNSNPFGLPFLTATASVVATGTGVVAGGNGTTPFVAQAPRWGSGVSIWGSALLVFITAAGWIL